jgi:hypothetical protein
MNKFERVFWAVCLAAVAVFVVVGIERPVWLDEANSVLIASHGLSGIVDSLRRENNLPAYYFLLHAWMRAFGDSEIALRLLSGLCYLGGGAAAFGLGKRVSGTLRGGWYSAFFYLSSPLSIRNAQNIRMYALLGMLSGLSALMFWKIFVERKKARLNWVGLVLVNGAGLLTHVWFIFVLAAQVAAVVAYRRDQLVRFVLGGVAAGIPAALLWGPSFWQQLHNGATDWMPRLQWQVVLTAATEFYGLLPALAIVVGVVAVGREIACPTRGMLLTIAIACMAVPLLICTWKPIYWPGRYLMIALSPIAVLIGTALSRPVFAVLAVGLLAIDVTGQIAQRDQNPETQVPPGQSDRATADFLMSHARPGDAIVFTSLSRAPADYYFQRAGAAGKFVEISFPDEVAQHMGWADPTVTDTRRPRLEAEAAETAQRLTASGHVWMYDGYAPAVSRILTDRLALPVLNVYALAGPYHRRIVEYGYSRQSAAFSASVIALPGVSTAPEERQATIPSGRTKTAPAGVIP